MGARAAVPVAAPVAERAAELTRSRTPFVHATVVRAQKPTSAHAGDVALVHADGRVEGFVGGSCAEGSVRTHALAALASGEPLLLRIRAGAAATTREEGAVTVVNPCLSGGSLEIFLEPRRPAPRLLVVGETPVARALAALGAPLGLAVEPWTADGDCAGAAAVVVASHGRGEEPALEAALRAGVPYVGLVASRARAAAVLASLGVEGGGRVHSPAGLDLGGRTAPEVALSILAQALATGALRASPLGVDPLGVDPAGGPGSPGAPLLDPPATAVDPVCGMTVAVTGATPSAELAGVRHHFCGAGCRAAFLTDPADPAVRADPAVPADA